MDREQLKIGRIYRIWINEKSRFFNKIIKRYILNIKILTYFARHGFRKIAL